MRTNFTWCRSNLLERLGICCLFATLTRHSPLPSSPEDNICRRGESGTSSRHGAAPNPKVLLLRSPRRTPPGDWLCSLRQSPDRTRADLRHGIGSRCLYSLRSDLEAGVCTDDEYVRRPRPRRWRTERPETRRCSAIPHRWQSAWEHATGRRGWRELG